jgi:tetratricopeptide (TPR) repeat protein
LGLSYQALDRNEEAVEHFRTAVSWNRRSTKASVWPPLNLGVLLMQMGHLEEADNLLQEAVRVDSGFAPAHYQLGLVLEKRDKLKESIRSLRTATKLKSDYPEPYWALTRVLRLAGDREGAEAALQQYLDLERDP